MDKMDSDTPRTNTHQVRHGEANRRVLIGGFAAALAFMTLSASAQSPDEHASHHPSGGAPNTSVTPGMLPEPSGQLGQLGQLGNAPPAQAAGPPTSDSSMTTSAAVPANPGMAGMTAPIVSTVPGVPGAMAAPASPPAAGMAGMMTGMMGAATSGGCMGGNCGPGGAAKTPIYSTLMTLPALTPEKRAEIDALATQQINEGMGRLATGSDSLARAAQSGDDAARQVSLGLMHEGLDVLGAGIAARRVLLEGKAPRNLALDWFKREMNLASPINPEVPHAFFGDAAFHLFAMVLLIAFALAMVAMYFFKMRRAAALFKRIEPNPEAPPPGTPPPLKGVRAAIPPVAPPVGKAPPTVGAPPVNQGAAPFAGEFPAKSSPIASSATLTAPATSNWLGQLRISRIVAETPSVKTFRLLPGNVDSLMPFTFVPGQFLNVAFGIGGARMNRSYSISSSPTERQYVELTVRREPRGAVSRHINDLLKIGDEIEAGGPVGRFTFTGEEAASIVLISGGVGITPMMSIARYLTDQRWPGDIFFIYACRAPEDFIFANEIAALQHANPKMHVTVTMSRTEGSNWQGQRGRLTKEMLIQAVPDLPSRRVHLCGPPSMMDATKAILFELGVPPAQVKTEAFGAVKPTPSPSGTSIKRVAPATGPLVTFSKNNKSAKTRDGQTVLELSEELGIGIQFSCRVGTCGLCKVKMASGEVEMAVEDALSPSDKANGIILACQAKPTSAISVEA